MCFFSNNYCAYIYIIYCINILYMYIIHHNYIYIYIYILHLGKLQHVTNVFNQKKKRPSKGMMSSGEQSSDDDFTEPS